MLHTLVAISMESLSQDKENDIGFIVLYPLLEKKVISYATYFSSHINGELVSRQRE
jgi:hypothetical protein